MVCLLWIFDTRNKGCGDDLNSEGCIEGKQITFFKETSRQINQEFRKKVNGLIFHHIPLPETDEMIL